MHKVYKSGMLLPSLKVKVTFDIIGYHKDPFAFAFGKKIKDDHDSLMRIS